MLKAVKESVQRMTSYLQLISGYLEMEDYANALGKTRETIKELRALAKSLTGLNGPGESGDDGTEGWGGRGSTWFHSGELRRCDRRRQQR
jgi:hypothetical protein